MVDESLKLEIRALHEKIEQQGQEIVRLNVKVELLCKKYDRIERLLEELKTLVDKIVVKPEECDRRFESLEKTQRWVATGAISALLLGFWDLLHRVMR